MIDASIHTESELNDLEQIFRSLIEKQVSLECTLKETQSQMQEIILAKLETERMLMNEKRELTDAKAQLKLMQNTMQQWEQDQSIQNETYVKQCIQLESLTNERDSLLENVKKLHVENIEINIKIEENEKRILNQAKLEELIQSNKASTNSVLQHISRQIQILEPEQNALKQSFAVAKTFGEHMIQLLKQHHKVLNETYAENYKLKEMHTSLLSELNSLKQSTAHQKNWKNHNNDCILDEHLQKCEITTKTLTDRISKEIDEKLKLQDLLKQSLNEQDKFCEKERFMKNQILELEKTVNLFKETEHKFPMTDAVVQTDH